MTIEGLSEKFNKEYWNYAKLISGVLRYRMPIEQVIKLVSSLQLDSESINTWKNGVERALKKYVTDGTEAKGMTCPNCGHQDAGVPGGMPYLQVVRSFALRIIDPHKKQQ